MTGDGSDGGDGERRAWGWVGALREGRTTPWSEWRTPADRGGRFLPGAQQLELLRRLNGAGRPSPALAERVLFASAPGRGRPDLQLTGASSGSAFGPGPVDPASLPDDELLRVATNLIAEDLVAVGTPPTARRAGSPIARWRHPYRLVGAEWAAAPLRAALVARGRPPGGRRPIVVVLGADPATLLAWAWAARSFDTGGRGWPGWLDDVVAHDHLPARADLAGMAARWAADVGIGRLRLTLDARPDPTAVGRVVGARGLPAPPPLPAADAVDLARRVAAPLGHLVLPARRRELLVGGLLPRLAHVPGPPLAVPERHRPWLDAQAARLGQELAAAGYPVIGRADVATGTRPRYGTGRAPSASGVLDLAMRLLLDPGR